MEIYTLMFSRSWTFLRQGGLSFVIFTKNKEGVRAIQVMKYKKYVAGKYTRARAPLTRKYANRIFESKDGITSMKIVNYTERHNLFLNDLLTKSNRTEIHTYKVEERTSGTPCNLFNRHFWGCMLLRTKRQVFKILVFCNMRCFIMFVTAVSVLFLQN